MLYLALLGSVAAAIATMLGARDLAKRFGELSLVAVGLGLALRWAESVVTRGQENGGEVLGVGLLVAALGALGYVAWRIRPWLSRRADAARRRDWQPRRRALPPAPREARPPQPEEGREL